MRNRRGLSTMVGAVFFIIAMTVAISYITYSMDTLDQFAQTVVVKSSVKQDQKSEEFKVNKLTVDNNKFNITVTNTGEIPINVTRLWVENVTSGVTTTEAIPKNCDIKKQVGPNQVVIKIGQSCSALTAKDTGSYHLKLVTERGNIQRMFVNSVGDQSLYLKLHASPSVVPTTFTTTLLLEVVNIGTNQLVNIKPEMDSVVMSCTATCSNNLIAGFPKPTTIDALNPGDTGLFTYVYSLTGENTDYATFTASLVNGLDEDTAVVTVQAVQSSLNADVALEAQGLTAPAPIDDSILLFHMESASTPGGQYQMYSGAADGGTNGLRIELDTGNPTFMTNNGTSQVIVPAGKWNASLTIQSEAMPTSLIGEDEGMIFHFEDGQAVDPDNSEGNGDADLEGCGGVGCSGWYSVGGTWTDRKQVVINGGDITDGPHTNFPVMVKITNDASLDATALDNGDDILFTNNDATIKLDHEIEHYSDGTLVAWVKVPSITDGTDVAICMYYGNDSSGPQENVAGTWSNNYEAVYHLHNDFTDSAKTHDGTNQGSSNATGRAAGGQNFVPVDEIELGTWSVSGSAITVEAWVNLDDKNQDDPRFLSKATGGGGTDEHVWMLGAGGSGEDKLRIRLKTGTDDLSGTTTLVAGGDDLSTGQWTHVALWYDGSNMKIFKDGQEVATTGKSGSLRVNSWKIVLGNHPDSSDTGWASYDGQLDEVRISTIDRDPGWMETHFDNLDDFSSFISITSGGGGGNPTYGATFGPHSSGAYQFDGINDCFESSNNISGVDDNDVNDEPDTTALWFKTDGTVGATEQYLVYWDGDGTCPACDWYKIALEASTGNVIFEFKTSNSVGAGITTCKSTNDYDDGAWYHVVGVRGVNGGSTNDDDCTLYITDVTGNNLETITKSESYGTDDVDADGRWVVGTNQEKSGNFFKGWIDDVIHWNGNGDDFLDAAEADDLAKTNYGNAAHKIGFYLTATDKDGVVQRVIVSDTPVPVPFKDPKDGGNDDDNSYSYFNHTMTLAQQTFAAQERLNATIYWVSGSATWEPLDVDMKIDDTGFTTPFPSYIQTPKPNPAFPSYYVYDNDFEFDVLVSNSGEDGIFFVYQGTRTNFNGTLGSYAGLIHRVNGTSSPGIYDLDENQDSIYIPSGDTARLVFYQPTDHPSDNNPSITGVLVPPGQFRVSIWLQGYSDQGETFTRSVILGTVNVID